MTPRDQHTLTGIVATVLLFGAVALAFALWAEPAKGQEPSTQLTIARAAVAECGWSLPDCHAAAWHFLRARSQMRKRGLERTARDYCAAWDSRNDDNERARWVRSLPAVDVSGAPAGWPTTASWPRHIRLWRRIYARAGSFLRGRVANPCNGTPVHTGAAYGVDLVRAKRAGWPVLQCGDTGEQRFYGRVGQ